MRLFFTKEEDRPSTFKCIRPDGTETWMKITQPFMLEHDLVHYAIETTLGFQQAFYGLLAQGYNITDFEAPRTQRPEALLPVNLPLEARQAEMLAGLFQTEIHDETELEDFVDIAKITFDAQQVAFPDITDGQVKDVRAHIRSLMYRWYQLSPGEVLTLTFPLSGTEHTAENSNLVG